MNFVKNRTSTNYLLFTKCKLKSARWDFHILISFFKRNSNNNIVFNVLSKNYAIKSNSTVTMVITNRKEISSSLLN